MGLILLATDVLLVLQRRSVVIAVAFDAARFVADSRGSAAEAEFRAQQLLHDPTATLRWSQGADTVRLRIRTRSPLVVTLGPLASWSTIDRTVIVRRELFRDELP